MEYFFIQALGFAGLALFLISYQFRSTNVLMAMQIFANICFGAQFVLLHAYSGFLSLMISIGRNFFFLNRKRWPWVNSYGFAFAVAVCFIVGAAFTWQGPLSALPCLAMCIGTFAYRTNNARTIRAVVLTTGCPAWIIYDAVVGSWGGVLNEALMMISIIVSIWRFGWKNLGLPQRVN